MTRVQITTRDNHTINYKPSPSLYCHYAVLHPKRNVLCMTYSETPLATEQQITISSTLKLGLYNLNRFSHVVTPTTTLFTYKICNCQSVFCHINSTQKMSRGWIERESLKEITVLPVSSTDTGFWTITVWPCKKTIHD